MPPTEPHVTVWWVTIPEAEARDLAATARALLRSVVVHTTGRSDLEVRAAECPDCGQRHGKPEVLLAERPLHVGVSRAGRYAVVAVSWEAPVGVDVEPIDAVSRINIDAAALTQSERDGLQALPPVDRPRARTRAWVRKEAVLKVHGVGLRISPDTVEAGVDEAPTRMLVDPVRVGQPVSVSDFELGDDHLGSVAVPGSTGMSIDLISAAQLLAAAATDARTPNGSLGSATEPRASN